MDVERREEARRGQGRRPSEPAGGSMAYQGVARQHLGPGVGMDLAARRGEACSRQVGSSERWWLDPGGA